MYHESTVSVIKHLELVNLFVQFARNPLQLYSTIDYIINKTVLRSLSKLLLIASDLPSDAGKLRLALLWGFRPSWPQVMQEISAHSFEVMASIKRMIEGVIFERIFDYLICPKQQKVDLMSYSPLFLIFLLLQFSFKQTFKVFPSNFALSRRIFLIQRLVLHIFLILCLHYLF